MSDHHPYKRAECPGGTRYYTAGRGPLCEGCGDWYHDEPPTTGATWTCKHGAVGGRGCVRACEPPTTGAEDAKHNTILPLDLEKPTTGEPIEVVAAVRRDGDRYWVCRRTDDGSHGGLAGMWEYPGGKVEEGETHEQALAREMWEEFGVRCTVGRQLDSIVATAPDYNDKQYRVTFYSVVFDEGMHIQLRCHNHAKWCTVAQLQLDQHLPSGREFNKRLADGADRLCRALYGRAAEPADYLGGSQAKMLHDAADRLASQPVGEPDVRKLHDVLTAYGSEVFTVGDGTNEHWTRDTLPKLTEQALRELLAVYTSQPLQVTEREVRRCKTCGTPDFKDCDEEQHWRQYRALDPEQRLELVKFASALKARAALNGESQ